VLETFTLQTFSVHLDEEFVVTPPDGGDLRLRLIDARGLGESPAEGLRAPFALVFRGPADGHLEQATYPVAHTRIGAFALFLVPIQPDADGPRYEAVFA
jgi:hypothetical protein